MSSSTTPGSVLALSDVHDGRRCDQRTPAMGVISPIIRGPGTNFSTSECNTVNASHHPDKQSWRNRLGRGTTGRLSGAAITGSAALGAADRWSDVDLAFGVADAARLPEVLADWTDLMYRDHRVRHHLDVAAAGAVYRVFFLANTLPVDLAFFPAAAFGATRPTFRLLFGTAVERPPVPPPATERLIGFAWLYALHARSSIERGPLW
jgi:hypothetical protein